MDLRSSESESFRFGVCELDVEQRILLRDGLRVEMQPRPFALLVYLIRRRDRVVSREEIVREVWEGISINAQAIRFAVHAVRRAVGDDGDAQRIVRTVPKVGWQFIGQVRAQGKSELEESHPLLQREHALRAAQLSVSDVVEGRGRVLMASGPAGIGKTAYLKKVQHLSDLDDFVIGVVRCAGVDAAPALWPWTALLRALLGSPRGGLLRSLLSKEHRELLWLLPELEDLSGDERVVAGRKDSGDIRSSRLRLFQAFSAQLRLWSEKVPVALFIDDLQHADPESRSLFRFVSEQLDESRVLLAGSFRTGGSVGEDVVGELSALAERTSVTSIRLGPLDAEGVGALIERIAETAIGDQVAGELAACTGGNPYFVELVAHHLVAEAVGQQFLRGMSGRKPNVVPRSVQEIVKTRLLDLDDSVRNLVAVASVVGAEIPVGILEAVFGSEIALDAIGAADRAGFLSLVEGEGLCVFPHALMREAVCTGLSLEERADLHERVATALEARGGSGASPYCAEIARHFAFALSEGSSAKAVTYLLQAARWSVQCAAFATAVDQLQWALRLPKEGQPKCAETRCEILIELGYVLGLDGKRERMQSALLEAAGIAKAAGDGILSARAALLYAPDLLVIETGVYDPTLVALLESALELLGDERCNERGQVLARLAMALHWSDEGRERILALIEGARSVAEALADEELERYVNRAERIALYSVGDPRRVLDGGGKFSTGGGPAALLDDVLRITSLLQLGRVREVDVRVEEFDQKQRAIMCASASWYVEMFRATMALLRGDYESARGLGRAYLEKGSLVQDQNAVHSYFLQGAMSAIDTGGLEKSEATVGAMVQGFPRVEGWQAGLCYLYAELGERDRACELLESLKGGGGVWANPRRNSWFGAVCSLSLACRILDVSDIADDLYSVLIPMKGQLAVLGFGSFCWGATDRFLGNLAALKGDRDVALGHFRDAVKLNLRCGARPAVAHCYREMAYFGYRFGVDEAIRYGEMAVEGSRGLGMRRLEEQAVEERRSR